MMLDGPQRMHRQAQPDHLAQRIRQQRGVLQIRQEPAAGLVVGVADIVARLHALAGDGTASGHDRTPSWLNLLGNRPPTWRPRPDPENEPGLYGTGRRRSSPAGGRRRLVQADRKSVV